MPSAARRGGASPEQREETFHARPACDLKVDRTDVTGQWSRGGSFPLEAPSEAPPTRSVAGAARRDISCSASGSRTSCSSQLASHPRTRPLWLVRKGRRALTRQLRSDLQSKLTRFFENGARPRGTNGDPVLGVGSTVGPHRLDNEDRAAVGVIRFPLDRRSRLQFAIVCDGMGGLEKGGAAASQAIATFIAVVATSDYPLRVALFNAIDAANHAVYESLGGKGGTTLTAVVSDPHEAWCAHVGDSRLYSSGPEGLDLLTQDDTIQGAIHAHEGLGNEDDLDNRLLQFVGVGESLSPQVFRVPLKAGHVWVVTSDGAHGIGRKALESLLEGGRNAQDIVRRMVFVADAFNVKDNASIAAMIQSDSSDFEPPSNGTTLTVLSPARRLEIWLFDSPSEAPESWPRNELAESESDQTGVAAQKGSGEPPNKGKPRGQAKAKRRRPKVGDRRPLEVLFESRKADDQPS